MIIHRFMSEQEYQALLSGKELVNMTRYARKGFKTTSVGFCFFIEDPEAAIHWLGGQVSVDRCVTFEVEEYALRKTMGLYADHNSIFQKIRRIEYCRQRYSLREFRMVCSTDKYKKYGIDPKTMSEIMKKLGFKKK